MAAVSSGNQNIREQDRLLHLQYTLFVIGPEYNLPD